MLETHMKLYVTEPENGPQMGQKRFFEYIEKFCY